MTQIYHNFQAAAESGLGIGNFYSVTVTRFGIQFQGHLSDYLLKICTDLGYKFEWQGNFLTSTNNEVINVTLTIKP